jgi:uncharacterized protein HemY
MLEENIKILRDILSKQSEDEIKKLANRLDINDNIKKSELIEKIILFIINNF